MSNFKELILDVMNDKGKTLKDLESDNILGKNTFYTFNKITPSLTTIIKISNYLNVPIDYLLFKSTDETFRKYKLNQSSFYNKLNAEIKSMGISQVKLCKDLNISRTNLSRWKNGTNPTLTKLISLAEYLNCNIDDLLEHE